MSWNLLCRPCWPQRPTCFLLPPKRWNCNHALPPPRWLHFFRRRKAKNINWSSRGFKFNFKHPCQMALNCVTTFWLLQATVLSVTYICIYTYTHKNMQAFIHIHLYIHTNSHIHMHIQHNAYTHICYTCSHVHKYIYIHIQNKQNKQNKLFFLKS